MQIAFEYHRGINVAGNSQEAEASQTYTHLTIHPQPPERGLRAFKQLLAARSIPFLVTGEEEETIGLLGACAFDGFGR